MSALKRLKAYVNVIFVIFVHCDLDSGRQDGPCEVGHVDAQEVTHFLRSCGDKRGGGSEIQIKPKERERSSGRTDAGVPVSSGMDAWSEWRSFLKDMFPN